MIEYFAGDERPAWQATVTIDGITEDLSTGHTFEVNLAKTRTSTPALTKTTGITGSAEGVVTVTWANGDLAIDPGTYHAAQITVTRTSDSREWTIEDTIHIKPRLVPAE